MSDTATPKNVPRGLRPTLPKRPKMDEDAWTRIQREQEKMKEREFVRFTVLKLDPAWRRLPHEEREKHKDEFEALVGEWGRSMMIYAYSLVGTRGDADFLLWQAGYPTSTGATHLLGDADYDGDVDGIDFLLWQRNYPYPTVLSSVPEPNSLALLVIGSLLMLKRRVV